MAEAKRERELLRDRVAGNRAAFDPEPVAGVEPLGAVLTAPPRTETNQDALLQTLGLKVGIEPSREHVEALQLFNGWQSQVQVPGSDLHSHTLGPTEFSALAAQHWGWTCRQAAAAFGGADTDATSLRSCGTLCSPHPAAPTPA